MTPPDPEMLRIPAFKRKKMLKAKLKSKIRLSPKLQKKVIKAKKTAKLKTQKLKKVIKMNLPKRTSITPTPRKSGPKLQPIGIVTHYYDRIHVGVLKLSASLHVGDRLKLKGKDGEFEQIVQSIQIEHESVTEAKRGADLGLKVDKEVRTDAIAYKIS